MRLKITKKAKEEARKALALRKTLPKNMRFGLDRQQARRMNVRSGVERAKQIVRDGSLNIKDARSVARTYTRFKNGRTKKIEGVHSLWGGRDFGKKAVEFVQKYRSKN